jgi:hypothetical protein
MKCLFFLLIIFEYIISQSDDISKLSIEAANLEYDGILGIGWGIFAIIIAIIIGVFCCIFGLSTTSPGLFNILGFLLPIVTFVFMISVPVETPELNEKRNQPTNPYTVIRWLFFSLMIFALLIICIPMCSLWRTILIPQRVDSRAAREYHEKCEKFMNDERERVLKEKRDKEMQMLKDKEALMNKENYNDTGFNPNVVLPIKENNNPPTNIEMGIRNFHNEEEDKLKEQADNDRRKRNLTNLRRKIFDKDNK